jgi:hypothetical protein
MSIALHALVLFLLLIPAVASVQLAVNPRWLGLRGVVRGGGGGGARQERLQYIQPVPLARRPVRPTPVVRRPARVPPPRPTPVVLPPIAPLPPAQIATSDQVSAPAGAGSSGVGPGAGGGVGGGVGTGTGTGTGPGTAGTPSERKLHALPPEMIPAGLDAPKDARPRRVVATFFVTPLGDAKLVSVTQTNDGGLNKRLRDEFEQMTRSRWQPAALDGIAVADTMSYIVDLP